MAKSLLLPLIRDLFQRPPLSPSDVVPCEPPWRAP